MSGSDRPRVLVATHLFPTEGGPLSGPWVAEQVDALAAHADVTVLAASQHVRDGSTVRASGARVEYRGIATPLGHGRAGLLASTVRYQLALDSHLRENPVSYDLVHAHFGFPDAVVVARACRRRALPFVVTLHGDDAFRVLPRRDPLGAAVRTAVTGADAVICVSAHMERAVRDAAPDAATIVISNGFDAGLFHVSNAPRSGVLFVGLLVPVKNLAVLLRAYASVSDRITDDLTIAGDGPLRADLVELARTLGIADRVRFTGRLDRGAVASLMATARVLVLPSSSEGWPLVITEALACGTPVVASAVGGIPEIVTSTEAGILVTAGEQDALAQALLDATAREWDPSAVATASGARSWAEQAQLIARVYRDVAAGGAR